MMGHVVYESSTKERIASFREGTTAMASRGPLPAHGLHRPFCLLCLSTQDLNRSLLHPPADTDNDSTLSPTSTVDIVTMPYARAKDGILSQFPFLPFLRLIALVTGGFMLLGVVLSSCVLHWDY